MSQFYWLCSIGEGHLEACRLLLDRGANLAARDMYKDTALHWAAWFGHLPVVQLLVQRGADVRIENSDGLTAQDMAAMRRHHNVVEWLNKQNWQCSGDMTMCWVAQQTKLTTFRRHHNIVKMALQTNWQLLGDIIMSLSGSTNKTDSVQETSKCCWVAQQTKVAIFRRHHNVVKWLCKQISRLSGYITMLLSGSTNKMTALRKHHNVVQWLIKQHWQLCGNITMSLNGSRNKTERFEVISQCCLLKKTENLRRHHQLLGDSTNKTINSDDKSQCCLGASTNKTENFKNHNIFL